MKVKKKSYIKLIILVILLVITGSSIYIMFNLRSILDIGHYHFSENERIEYGTFRANINYEIDLKYDEQAQDYDVDFYIHYTSNQINKILGILSIDYRITVSDNLAFIEKREFSDPIKEYFIEFNERIDKDEQIVISGNITLLVNINGETEEIQSVIDIDFTLNYSPGDYYYQFEMGRVWFEILLIVCFIALLFLLIRVINDIRFQKEQTIEEKTRSESYFEYFRKENERLSKEE